jgi:hypothetical protein
MSLGMLTGVYKPEKATISYNPAVASRGPVLCIFLNKL